MSAPVLPATEVQDYVMQHLGGEHGTYCGGSAGAAARARRHPYTPHFEYTYGDIDWFGASPIAVSAAVRRLLENGAAPADPQELVKWERWQDRGMGSWHTNSIRIETKDKVEFNLIYKEVDRHALRTPTEVIGSFDFSNVSMGVDTETGEEIDLFHAYWYGQDPDVVRLFPDRRKAWAKGRFTKYPGIRQGDRYCTNVEREYDMHATAPILVQGYRIAAAHYLDQRDPDDKAHADVYRVIADLIESDSIHDLRQLYKDVGPDKRIEDFQQVLMLV